MSPSSWALARVPTQSGPPPSFSSPSEGRRLCSALRSRGTSLELLGERRRCLRSRPEVIPRRRARGVHVRGVHLKGPRQASLTVSSVHRPLRFPGSDGARASGALDGLDDPPGDFRARVLLRLLDLPLDILAASGRSLGHGRQVNAVRGCAGLLSESDLTPSPRATSPPVREAPTSCDRPHRFRYEITPRAEAGGGAPTSSAGSPAWAKGARRDHGRAIADVTVRHVLLQSTPARPGKPVPRGGELATPTQRPRRTSQVDA